MQLAVLSVPSSPSQRSRLTVSFRLTSRPSVSDSEVRCFRRPFPFCLSGFLKVGSGKLRAYLTYDADRTTIAVDLPIAEDGAESVRTASAAILGELAALLRPGIPDQVTSHEVAADPYCDRAFDLFTWFLGSARP